MPSLSTALPLLLLITLSKAAPAPDSYFDANNLDTQTNFGTITFAPEKATCATHPVWEIAKGKDRATAAVNAKPDCDTVIDNICQAAVRRAFPGDHGAVDLRSGIYSQSGTCEGHMLFSWFSAPQDFSAAACKEKFNLVQDSCMVGAATAGSQAGALNVWWSNFEPPYYYAEVQRMPRWPGYLLGPVGYFGDMGDTDAVSIPA